MLIVLTLYLAFLKSAGIALLEVFLLQRENHSCFTFFIVVLCSDVKESGVLQIQKKMTEANLNLIRNCLKKSFEGKVDILDI